MELDALRASSRGELDQDQAQDLLAQLVQLKILALEKHQAGFFAGDQQFAHLVGRIESLQEKLPGLACDAAGDGRVSVALPPSRRKAG